MPNTWKRSSVPFGWISGTSHARFLICTAVLATLFWCLTPSGQVQAEDWRNVVQPIGTPYTGLLNLMEVEGVKGPLLTPTEANSLLGTYRSCTYPPFDASVPVADQTLVTLIRTTQTLYFARLFNTSDPNPNNRSNPAGSWVMRAATIRGLTAEQIRDVFSLPAVPTGISYARIPTGHVLWTGIAGPINSTVNPTYPDWGRGGGEQTLIDQRFATADSPAVVFVSMDLTGRALLYAPKAGTGNAGSVAAYFDSLIPSPATPDGTIDLAQYQARNLVSAYSSLDGVLGSLDWLSFTDLTAFSAALNQVSPERYDALPRIGVRNNLQFARAFGRRSQSGRTGAADFEQASNSVYDNSPFATERFAWADGWNPAASVPHFLADSSQSRMNPIIRNLWAAGMGEFGSQNDSGEHTGFDFASGGLVIGSDLFRHNGLTIGAGAGYLGSSLDWNDSGGNASIDSAKFGIYSSYAHPCGLFVDSLLAGGFDWKTMKRNIVFLDVAQTAHADTTGCDFMAQVRGGYDFPVGGWTVSPVAELTYIYLHQDGFDESGADVLDLTVRSMNNDTFRTLLGIRVEKGFALSENVRAAPALEIGWAHEIPLDNRSIEAGLIGQSGTFPVKGVDWDTDTLVIDASLKTRLSGNLNLSVGYNAEMSDDFLSHQVGIGLKYRF